MDTSIPVYTTAAQRSNAINQADGFVVVTEWLPGRYTSNRHTYDHFVKLEDAVGYHRAVEAGKRREYAAKGIFAVRDGMPIGGMLDVSVIDAVQPAGWSIPDRGAQSTPENRKLLEHAIYNGRRAL